MAETGKKSAGVLFAEIKESLVAINEKTDAVNASIVEVKGIVSVIDAINSKLDTLINMIQKQDKKPVKGTASSKSGKGAGKPAKAKDPTAPKKLNSYQLFCDTYAKDENYRAEVNVKYAEVTKTQYEVIKSADYPNDEPKRLRAIGRAIWKTVKGTEEVKFKSTKAGGAAAPAAKPAAAEAVDEDDAGGDPDDVDEAAKADADAEDD